MKKHSQKYIAWILISIFGVACSVLSGSKVLCVGDEGHSKIEQAVVSCCDQVVPHLSKDDLSSDAHQGDECGDCSDVDVSGLVAIGHKWKSSHDLTSSDFNSASYINSKLMISSTPSEKKDISQPFNLTFSQLTITNTVLIC
jgi:hypothetical protein